MVTLVLTVLEAFLVSRRTRTHSLFEPSTTLPSAMVMLEEPKTLKPLNHPVSTPLPVMLIFFTVTQLEFWTTTAGVQPHCPPLAQLPVYNPPFSMGSTPEP
jgi:hypothetical protein